MTIYSARAELTLTNSNWGPIIVSLFPCPHHLAFRTNDDAQHRTEMAIFGLVRPTLDSWRPWADATHHYGLVGLRVDGRGGHSSLVTRY
jgi:hypothetical protein